MRELSADDLGVLLSVFAVLLLAFGVDFHLSRREAGDRRRLLGFAVVSVVGEVSAAIALVLTWISLWSSDAWEYIDDWFVLVPGSIAVLSAVVLAAQKAFARLAEFGDRS